MGDGGQKDIKRFGISQGLVPEHLLQNLLGELVKMQFPGPYLRP